LVILVLTGLPGSFRHTHVFLGVDKVVHFLMFCGFAFACLWGYRKPYRGKTQSHRLKAVALTIGICAAYGALTEIMQEYLIPGRTGSVYDWLADFAGIVVGAALFYFFNRKGNNLQNQSFYK
jgi:VanZ family protein